MDRRRFLKNMAAAMVAPVISLDLAPAPSVIDSSVSAVHPTQADWSDPFVFAHICWPDKVLYERQHEIMVSVRDNIETFVPAANEMGKTHIAAMIATWFFATRTPSRVIMFSSSQEQLHCVLWPEVKSLISESRVDFGWRVVEHRITKYTDNTKTKVRDKDQLVAHVTSEVENFHGVHLPEDRPRILVIFDEASAVEDAFLIAAESFASRILVIGNPMNNVNFFYRGCKGGDIVDPVSGVLLRKVIQIDGEDSPNVKAGRMAVAQGKPIPENIISGLMSYEYMVRNAVVWDEETKARRLHGVFYEGDESMLIPFDWLDHSMDPVRWKELWKEERHAEAMGLDVAQGGGDLNCWTIIDRYGILKQITKQKATVFEKAKITMDLMLEHGLTGSQVAIDAGGGGIDLGDVLRKGFKDAEGNYRNLAAKIVHFGEAPGADDSGRGKVKKKRMAWSGIDPRKAYFNRRAEMYGGLRTLMNPSQPEGSRPFMIGPEAWKLRKELAPVPLLYDEEGRMYMLAKSDRVKKGSSTGKAKDEVNLIKLIGHSPDRSDSLVLAVHALRYGRGKPKAFDIGSIEVDQKKVDAMNADIMKKVKERMEAARAKMANQRR